MYEQLSTSVVMATYNGEKNILEQLDSLLSQTKKINEVLICDDCSTDNTVD
ncbi:glycosyltransferase, partial [Enterococcus faecium]